MRTKKKTTIKNSVKFSLVINGVTVVLSYDKKRLIEDYEHYFATSLIVGRDAKSIREIIKKELLYWHKNLNNKHEKFHYITVK